MGAGIATPPTARVHGHHHPAEAFHPHYVKTGAQAETARRLAPAVKKGERIALGTATDPTSPVKRPASTRPELVAQCGTCARTDQGRAHPARPRPATADPFPDRAERPPLPDHAARGAGPRLDPWAPPPDVRIEVMPAGGGRQWPGWDWLPRPPPSPTTSQPDLLLGRVAGAELHMFANVLFLRSHQGEVRRWLAADFPAYLEAYHARLRRAGLPRRALPGDGDARVRACARRGFLTQAGATADAADRAGL